MVDEKIEAFEADQKEVRKSLREEVEQEEG